ncbi:MAG: hypothetical protein ABIQ86_08500 [Steroidobacteraceae bacterium]
MRRPVRLLFAVLLAVVAGSAFPAATTGEGTRVVAQDLVTLRPSNKVSAAIWTRRANYYTLQLVMRQGLDASFGARTLAMIDGRRMAATSRTIPTDVQPSKKLDTSVWLLRADGTQILPAVPSTNPSLDSCSKNLRCIAVDVLYRFSIADATAAVAVAVRIGDDFYIEKLQPLEQSSQAD